MDFKHLFPEYNLIAESITEAYDLSFSSIVFFEKNGAIKELGSFGKDSIPLKTLAEFKIASEKDNTKNILFGTAILKENYLEVKVPPHVAIPLKTPFGSLCGLLCLVLKFDEKLPVPSIDKLITYGNKLAISILKKIEDDKLLKKSTLLNDNVALFSQTMTQAKIGAWSYDVLTGELYWSKSTYLLHEVDSTFRPSIDAGINFYHPECKQRIENYMYDAITKGLHFSDVLKLTTKLGNELWVQSIGQTELKNGKCVKVYGTFQDITEKRERQIELERSENKYRSIIENSFNSFLITSPNGDILEVNVAASILFGYSREEFKKLKRQDVIDITDPRLTIMLEKRRSEGKTEGELTAIRKGGEKFQIYISSSQFLDVDGVLKTSMTIIDISEKEKHQLELKRNEEKYRLITENIKDIICEHLLDGSYTYVSPSFTNQFGYTLEETIGTSPYDYVHLDDQNNIFKNSHKKSMKGQYNHPIRFRFRKKDGSYIWCETVTNTIFKDGVPNKLNSATRIVEDQVALEIKLANSRDTFKFSFNKAAIAMALVGTNGKWIKANKSLRSLFGYSKKELYQRTFNDITHPEDVSIGEELLKQLLNKEIEKCQIEKRYIAKNGSIIWVSLNTSAVLNRDGTILYFIAQLDNITDRKIQQAKLQALNDKLEANTIQLKTSNEELEQFAFIASHDLKEPLRMINSFMQLLDKNYSPILDDRAKKYIHFAKDGSKRMSNLIDELLAYAKLGTIDSNNLKPVDLNAIVNEIISLLSSVVEKVDAVINYNQLLVIQSNHTAIKIILTNLISNALKYQAKGVQPILKIGASEFASHWEISVTDNGIGIPEAKKGEIFQIFKRLHSSSEFSGNGMGLATSRKIVQKLDGQIWVESNKDKGSIFYVTIPKKIAI